jgi:hypothetical protein
MAPPKPLRSGVIRKETKFNEIYLDFQPAIAALRNLEGPEAQKLANRALRSACRFYVSRRLGNITTFAFRQEVNKLAHAMDKLDASLARLSDFTRGEIYIDDEGRAGGLEALETALRFSRARLARLQKEEARQGSDFKDPVGTRFALDVLRSYMTLTGRTRPPSIRFDAREARNDDDISHSEFGVFFEAVLLIVTAGLEKAGVPDREKFALRLKRAAIRGALRAVRARSS